MEKKRILQGMGVLLAVALIFGGVKSGIWSSAVSLFQKPEVASAMIYLSTGRLFRQAAPTVDEAAPQNDKVEQISQKEPVSFFPEDRDLIEVYNYSGYETDVEGYLTKPLIWNLRTAAPTVLILHTHGSESYENTDNYQELSAYRTEDAGYNVVSIGEKIREILEKEGVQVIHDTTLHDRPSYDGAYTSARTQTQAYLEKHPSVEIVLDIHRDSIEDSSGKQVAKTVQIAGEEVAQLMFVVGSDAGGQNHPQWSENMALAVKMQAQLEKRYPGICRPICFRGQRYNQDLSPGALIVEVGSAGNTQQQALKAGECLAQCVLDLAQGSLTPT